MLQAVSLEDPVVIGLPPNIKYSIMPLVAIPELCQQLTDELQLKWTDTKNCLVLSVFTTVSLL